MKKVLLTAAIVASLAACSDDSPQDLKAKAQESLAKNELNTAEIHLKNLLQAKGDDGEARLMLADIYVKRRNWASAEKEIRRALQYGIKPDRVAVNLMAAMSVTANPLASVTQADKLASTDPKVQSGVSYYKGIALSRLGKRDEAIAELEKSITLDSEQIGPKISLFKLKAQIDETNLRESISSLGELVEQHPDNIEVLVTQSDFLGLNGDTGAAWELLRKAHELAPNNAQTLVRMASNRIEARKFSEAVEFVDKGLKVAPSFPMLLTQKAQLELHAERFGSALDAATAALSKAPDFIPALSVAAAAAMGHGSLERAETYSNRLLALAPDAVKSYQMLGSVLLKKGEARKALELLQPVIATNSSNADLLALAGEAAIKSNQPLEARKFLEGATQIDSRDPAKRLYLAMAKLSAGDNAGGMTDLQTAAKMDTDSSVANFALISQYIKARDFEQANAAIAELEKKQPGSAAVPYLKGMVFLAQQNLLAARTSLNKAIEIDSQYFEAAARLAAIDVAEGKRDDAKQRLNDFLAAEPEHEQALLTLAQLVLAEPGNDQAAFELIERAASAKPESVRPVLLLASLHIKTKAPAKAVDVLEAGLKVNEDHPQLLEAMANAQTVNKSNERALATIDKLTGLRPNDAGIQYRMAGLRLRLSDFRGAVAGFRVAQKLQPNSIEPRVGLAMAQARMGRVSEAFTSAKEMQTALPDRAAGWLLEGELHRAQRNWSKAAAAYAKGQDVEPDNGKIFFRLDAALRQANAAEEADARLAKALIKLPDDPLLRRLAGDVASTRKDYAVAVSHYEKAVSLSPSDAVAWNNLAWTQHQRGDKRAISSAEKAVALKPDSAPTIDTLAGILADTNELERAIELQTRAVELAPATASFQLKLANMLKKSGQGDAARQRLNALLQKFPNSPEAASAKQLLGSL